MCDVSRPDQVQRLVARTEEIFGGLRAMPICIGSLRTDSVLDTTEGMLDRIIDINLKSVFYGCKYAIVALIRSGGGSIVNWGSVNSLVAEPEIAAYSATKGAVLIITDLVALEHAGDDIRASCLCPGGVKTAMVDAFFESSYYDDGAAQCTYQPLGLIAPEEIADVAVFPVSDESRKMMGGAVLSDASLTAR